MESTTRATRATALQREPRESILTRTAVETLGTSHLQETGVWHHRGTKHQFSFARRRQIKLERTVFFLLVTGWTERTLLSWLLPQPPTWPHIGNWSVVFFFFLVAWQSRLIPVSPRRCRSIDSVPEKTSTKEVKLWWAAVDGVDPHGSMVRCVSQLQNSSYQFQPSSGMLTPKFNAQSSSSTWRTSSGPSLQLAAQLGYQEILHYQLTALTESLGLICPVCQLSSSFPVIMNSIPYVFSRDRWGAVRRMDWVVQPPGW